MKLREEITGEKVGHRIPSDLPDPVIRRLQYVAGYLYGIGDRRQKTRLPMNDKIGTGQGFAMTLQLVIVHCSGALGQFWGPRRMPSVPW